LQTAAFVIAAIHRTQEFTAVVNKLLPLACNKRFVETPWWTVHVGFTR
jgi:hypothetical protein